MTFDEFISIADGVLALVAVAASIRAAKRHIVKRYLWVMTAVIMGYFVLLAYQAITGTGSAFVLGTLIRPALGLLFLVIIAHALVDSREH